jgi:hypothetical protein
MVLPRPKFAAPPGADVECCDIGSITRNGVRVQRDHISERIFIFETIGLFVEK